MERRYSDNAKSHIELRDINGSTAIVGYAAVFYRAGDEATEYPLTPRIVERIQPGAFDDIGSQDVIGVFNHNEEYLLGRSSNGTLELRVDNIGLHYSIPYDESDDDHRKVASKIRRGDVTGSSFMFKNPVYGLETERRNGQQVTIRNITGLPLVRDVGPVTFPAYRGTAAGIRSCVHSRAEIDLVEQDVRKWLAEQDNRKNVADCVTMETRFRELQLQG